MAGDYDSQLPVRSKQDAHERVQVKIVDEGTPTQMMTVDADKNAHVEVHGNDPSGTDRVLKLSQLGNANTDGVYDGTDNTKPAHSGLIGHVRAATPANSDLTNRITSKTGTATGSTDVHALDVSLHDSGGNAISSTNPLPVFVTEDIPGTEVWSYQPGVDIAKGSPDTNTYTPNTGKTFCLQQISASASGKLKVEVKWGATSSETTKLVFFTSTACPYVIYRFAAPQLFDDTKSILVVVTNLDNAAMNTYSSIEGVEY